VTRGPTGATRKAVEAKKRLLEESVRLIQEQGLAGLSFREMSRRAGVSHQLPYHHFSSREGILAAIALEGFTDLDDALVAAAARHARSVPQKVLREVVRAYVVFALKHPVHFRVMFRPELVLLQRHPDVLAKARASFGRLLDAVASCHSDVKRNDPQLLEIANALWAAAHGLATLWLDGPMRGNSPRLSLNALIDSATEMFSEAGASARRFSQRSSDKLSPARTASSSTT
jgi:AcrR family transcriptional regulator